ncbi:AI-2E family transporter [Candidatus Latescibacterota bacterium]
MADVKTIIRYVFPLVIIVVVLYVFFKFILILAPFVIAYILNFGLKPFVNLLEQRGMRHTLAVICVFLGAFGLLTVLFILLVPAIASEVSSIQSQLDDYISVLVGKVDAVKASLTNFSAGFSANVKGKDLTDQISSGLNTVLSSFIKSIPGLLFNFLPLIMYVGIIPFATFFLLLDDANIKKKLIVMVPNRYFETTLLLLYSLNYQMGQLLRGMFASAVIISILASSGLWVIKLDYPILIGIFAGMSNLIPYVGPIVGTFAAFLVAVMTAKPLIFFLFIVLVFLCVNLIDNVFVQPIIMSKAANLHPLVVIILVLLGSNLGGIVGMFLAVPLASLIQVFLKIGLKELKRPRKTPISEMEIVSLDKH